MKEEELEKFIGMLTKVEELRTKLPHIYIRLPLASFLSQNAQLWSDMRSKIIARYPQYSELLFRRDLAFRVAYRPVDSNKSLPGFTDGNHETENSSHWNGMDYRPQKGEYIGMTRETPWTFYMLPDVRYADPEHYHTFMYIYDNTENQLVREGQSTTVPLPEDNHLTDFLQMIVNIHWVNSPPGQPVDPLVFDTTLEKLEDYLARVLEVKKKLEKNRG